MAPTILHGKRVEAMFRYVAASLGRCRMIKQEDSGAILTDDDAIKVPDYRIITLGGDTYLIEVKNFYSQNFSDNFILKESYLDSLQTYSVHNKSELYFAIYWAKFRIWTLNSPDDFCKDNGNYHLEFINAVKKNYMYILGDMRIGTIPNLSIKLYVDSKKENKIIDEMASFVINKVEVLCNDKPIRDDSEKNIALYLIFFGEWEMKSPELKQIDNFVEFIEYVCEPEDDESYEKNGFQMIGTLSTMISNYYTFLTAPEGKIKYIEPKVEKIMLGISIPVEYNGTVLPLWRFVIKPQSDLES